MQTRHGDRFTVRVLAIRAIPPRIFLLFSEAVNHLRAALDNVIWYLVERAQGPMTGHAATQVALPIYDDDLRFAAWQRRRVRAGVTACDSTTALGQRIRALQPFVDCASRIPSTMPMLAVLMGVEVEDAQPLVLLQGYSNDDKHRTIRVAVPRTTGGRVDHPPGGSDRAFVELRVGDVVAEGHVGSPGHHGAGERRSYPTPAPIHGVSRARQRDQPAHRLCGAHGHTNSSLAFPFQTPSQ